MKDELCWEVEFLNPDSDDTIESIHKFFKVNFPHLSKKSTSKESFKLKLSSMNPNGSGIVTVARINNEIVGIATGVKKRISHQNKIYSAIEIGDTYTRVDFRKSGRAKVKLQNEQADNYLDKSIFGRLVTELLEEARKQKIQIVYGVPNEESLKPYLNRLSFIEMNDHDFCRYTLPTATSIRTENLHPLVKLAGLAASAFFQLATKCALFNYYFIEVKNLDKILVDGYSFDRTKNCSSIELSSKYLCYQYENIMREFYFFYEVRKRISNELIAIIVCRNEKLSDGRQLMIVSRIIAKKSRSELIILSSIRRIARRFMCADNSVLILKNSSISWLVKVVIGMKRSDVDLHLIWKSVHAFDGNLLFDCFEFGDCDQD